MHEPSSQSAGSDLDLSQFYAVFFEEASENLGSMESLLLEIDVAAPEDEQLNAIFRCAHSIKGGSATFGFQDVADLTHVMETLLDRLRRHEITIVPAMVDVLLESGDALSTLLARHQGRGGDAPDTSGLVKRIAELTKGGGAAAASAPAAAAPAASAPAASAPAASAPAPAPAAAAQADAGAGLRKRGEMPEHGTPRTLELSLEHGGRKAAVEGVLELFADIEGLGFIQELPARELEGDVLTRFKVVTVSSDEDMLDLFTFHIDREGVHFNPWNEAAAAAGATAAPDKEATFGFFDDAPGAPGSVPAPAPVAVAVVQTSESGAAVEVPAGQAHAVTAPRPAGTPAPRADQKGSAEASTLRVSVEKVDQLINLVGELVITQAMLAQTGRGLDPVQNQQLHSSLSDLERNTRMLQESVLAVRMIPMVVVFNRFPRMLRDLAAKLGKQIELLTVGEATELDKGMVEKITDPLTHLVRNSVDHGIEPPDERRKVGKSPVGKVTLSAEHRGGSIVIEVRDDGRGLSRSRLLAKAAERGLPCSPTMTDQEVFGLIFEPGFSTAAQITEVSGRGVGMDVVKRNILGLGGTVDIDSSEGHGTRVSVRLPLTLAIMDGMSVGVGDEVYIVPLASVVESIQLDGAKLHSVAGSDRLIRVRDEYLPVLALEEFFGVHRFEERTSEVQILVVVEAEGLRAAVLVDRLVGQQQIVVKNLEANYRKVDGISGATILGDGKVALILDIGHLVRRVRN